MSQENKLRPHHLYTVNGSVMKYLNSIQYGANIHNKEYKFVCVGAKNYEDYKEIKKAFRTNKFQRTEKQKQIIKNCYPKRITILKKDFKKNKVKFVLGQPIEKTEPVSKHGVVHQKDYTDWLQSRRSL